MHNPYQSPAASAGSVATPTGKRPISLWFLLFILGGMTLLLALGIFRSAVFLAAYPERITPATLFDAIWRIGTAIAVIAALNGILRRRQWTRWLIAVLLGGLTALMMLMPDTTEYANGAERAGGFLGRLFLAPAFMIWWAYACAFSDKARRYFMA